MILFPIQAWYGNRIKVTTTDYIPFNSIKSHEEQAMHNHGQSLERLAQRGGLSYDEALAILQDRPYCMIRQDIAKKKVYENIMCQEEK